VESLHNTMDTESVGQFKELPQMLWI